MATSAAAAAQSHSQQPHSGDDHDDEQQRLDDEEAGQPEEDGGSADEQQQQHDEGEYDEQGEDEQYAGTDSQQQQSSLPIIAADEAPVDTSAVYSAFGRDTAAGRALFKLYNKNKTNYTPSVKVSVRPGGPTDPAAEAAMLKRLRAAQLSKPKYVMPNLQKPAGPRPVGRPGLGGGIKTQAVIEAERARDAHLFQAPRAPPGMMQAQSRDEQKRKLQEAMEGRGSSSGGASGSTSKLPAPLPGRGPVSAPRASKDPNVALSESILSEIEERHAFLDAMRARGAADLASENAVKGEIAERMRDLKQIDAIIAEERAERAAMAAGKAAAAPASGIPTRAGSGNRKRP